MRTYCEARVNRRLVSQAVVIATGRAADGHREVLGRAVGDSEDGAFGPCSWHGQDTRADRHPAGHL